MPVGAIKLSATAFPVAGDAEIHVAAPLEQKRGNAAERVSADGGRDGVHDILLPCVLRFNIRVGWEPPGTPMPTTDARLLSEPVNDRFLPTFAAERVRTGSGCTIYLDCPN